ncbi:hypothetical protein [Blautia sp.]
MNWYSRPWLCVLRFENKEIASLIADMAEKISSPCSQNLHKCLI